MKRSRRKHDPEFKAKVALDAIREEVTAQQLAVKYGVHPMQVTGWRRALVENAALAFTDGRAPDEPTPSRDELLQKIGELTVERDFLANGLRRLR